MCKKQFGTWRDALLAAGIEARIPHNWSRERIVRELRKWIGREETRIYREDPFLYQAAIRYFKTWPAAQAAAGLTPDVSNEWSRERVLHELRKWHQKCEDRCVRVDPKLRAAARRYFGNIREALAAAGLSQPVSGKKWSPKRVILAIQDRHVRGLQIQQPYGADPSLADAAKRLFGSWQAALIASGLGSEYRPGPVWTKERLIEEIQRRHRQRRRMSQNANRDLAYFVRKHFGHWKEATGASGLSPADLGYPSPRTREELIGVIQRRHREGHSMRAEDNRDVMRDVRKVFGGWIDAQFAAGLEPRYIIWTRERLVLAIRNRLQQGPIPFEDRIRSAARRHFGSWQNALVAAGLEKKDTPCRGKT